MPKQTVDFGDLGVTEADIVPDTRTREQMVAEYYGLISSGVPYDSPEAKKIRESALARFANPQYPQCWSCVVSAARGGPRHEASSRCRSGKHDHCSCDLCF